MFHVEHSMENLDRCPITGSPLSDYISCKDYTVSSETFNLMTNVEGSILSTNPRPEMNAIGKYYESEEYISHTDSKKSLFEKLYQVIRSYSLRKKRRLVEGFIKGKGSILDIGSGTGDFLLEMKSNGWSINGVEPNDDARAKAEAKLDIVLSQDTSLSGQADASQSAVTMWHVLEHVPNPSATAEKIYDILKPGGFAIIAVPNYRSKDAEIYGKYWAAYDVPRHLFHFSQPGMRYLFEQKGFKHKGTRPMVFDSYYVSLLSEKHKTGTQNWIRATINGFRSNLAARRSGEWSSLIYIFQKPL